MTLNLVANKDPSKIDTRKVYPFPDYPIPSKKEIGDLFLEVLQRKFENRHKKKKKSKTKNKK